MTAPTIVGVEPGSPAERAGARPGDRLVSINRRRPRDIIDYQYLSADAALDVRLRRGPSLCSGSPQPGPDRASPSAARGGGAPLALRVEKDPAEPLGLRFAAELFDGLRTCTNRCAFCFVHQLPRGLRRSLYVLDDDYRLSFLHGNFITLTNLGETDLRRIIRQRLSPLYVSVHATDPEVRNRLMRCRRGAEILPMLRRLTRAGIQIHAQVVLCPGMNDGEVLERTVADLAALRPGIASLAIVPVGLTSHRERLPCLRPVTPAIARDLLEWIHLRQRRFLKEAGSRFMFAADELYVMAGAGVPSARAYEGFRQLENGVGLVRRFLDQVRRARVPPQVRGRSATLVTGTSAAPLVQQLADRLAEAGVRVQVAPIRNRLLGESVTVAGLLAGRDVIRQLRRRWLGEVVIVPAVALREGAFLDDVTLDDARAALGIPVLAAATPGEAVRALRSF